jgi:hypothetical protein
MRQTSGETPELRGARLELVQLLWMTAKEYRDRMALSPVRHVERSSYRKTSRGIFPFMQTLVWRLDRAKWLQL